MIIPNNNFDLCESTYYLLVLSDELNKLKYTLVSCIFIMEVGDVIK